jgi:hypothetical protein
MGFCKGERVGLGGRYHLNVYPTEEPVFGCVAEGTRAAEAED